MSMMPISPQKVPHPTLPIFEDGGQYAEVHYPSDSFTDNEKFKLLDGAHLETESCSYPEMVKFMELQTRKLQGHIDMRVEELMQQLNRKRRARRSMQADIALRASQRASRLSGVAIPSGADPISRPSPPMRASFFQRPAASFTSSRSRVDGGLQRYNSTPSAAAAESDQRSPSKESEKTVSTPVTESARHVSAADAGGSRQHTTRVGLKAQSSEFGGSNRGDPDTFDWRWISQRIFVFLDDPYSSIGARMYDKIIPTLIMTQVFVTIIQTSDPPLFSPFVQSAIELTLDSFFALELLVRLVVSPSQIKFFKQTFNIIDLATLCAIPLRATTLNRNDSGQEDIAQLVLLCFVPVLRLMKTLRHFEALILVADAFTEALEALPVLLFILCVIVLVFSSLIYLVEPRTSIPSMPVALYFTTVSLSTVGYGDVTPDTTGGTIVTMILIITGVMYMSIPLGMIGNVFCAVWQDRDRRLIKVRARRCLDQWGYKASDMPLLFAMYDPDLMGEVDLDGFRLMISDMRIGFPDERIVNLFDIFDVDGGGSISAEEFVRTLYPGDYKELFSNETQTRVRLSR